MSDDLVKRARDVLNGATPGPWERDMSYQWPSKVRSLDEKHRHRWVVDVSSFPDSTHTISDARFIAASRELVPAMADRIEDLEAKLAKAVAAWMEWSNCDAEVLIDAAIERMNNAVAELTGGKDE